MKSWDEFKKYVRWDTNELDVRWDTNELDFYGCVDKDGMWFDSAKNLEVAVHFCCYYAGEFELDNEIEWMNTEGCKRGYSVIHGTMIKQMYEKGLIT